MEKKKQLPRASTFTLSSPKHFSHEPNKSEESDHLSTTQNLDSKGQKHKTPKNDRRKDIIQRMKELRSSLAEIYLKMEVLDAIKSIGKDFVSQEGTNNISNKKIFLT